MAKGKESHNDKKLKRKKYEKELRRLQAELCKLQDWVRHKGLRVKLLPYDLSNLPYDPIAGLSVAAVALPRMAPMAQARRLEEYSGRNRHRTLQLFNLRFVQLMGGNRQ